MTTTSDLEDRLRRGLQAAGEALPAAAHEPPVVGEGARPRPSHRAAGRRGARSRAGGGRRRPAHRAPSGRGRWGATMAAVGVAAAAVVAVVGVVATRDGGDGTRGGPAVRSAPERQTTTTTAPPHEPGPANGDRPGEAVIRDDVLHAYDDQSRETGTVDLAPLDNIQAASSDLDGGWVVCGDLPVAPAEESGLPAGATSFRTTLMWFPRDRDPVELQQTSLTMCMADSVQVVDSPEGPTAVYDAFGGGAPVPEGWHAVVLATGADRALDVAPGGGFRRWAAATDRLAVHVDETGLRLHDLATGAEVPIAPIDIESPSDLSLAPDGTSLAVITGDVSGPTELVVHDLATGEERFRESMSMPAEGAQLSYDGERVAFGNWYEGNGPVTVVDLATGARHTIDTHGLVL